MSSDKERAKWKEKQTPQDESQSQTIEEWLPIQLGSLRLDSIAPETIADASAGYISKFEPGVTARQDQAKSEFLPYNGSSKFWISPEAAPCSQKKICIPHFLTHRTFFTLFVEPVSVHPFTRQVVHQSLRDETKALGLNHLCWLCLETRSPASVLISLFYFFLLQVNATEALPRTCQQVATKDGQGGGQLFITP